MTTPVHPSAEQEQRHQQTRLRQRDLVGVLEAMAQLAKFRHDRRLLLHSLGDGLAHFLASLVLALGRRLAELGGDGARQQGEWEEKDALVFLVTCLLLAMHVFAHSVPAHPHYCRLLEERSLRDVGRPLLPPRPWSCTRVAALARGERVLQGGGGGGAPDGHDEEDNGGLLERSMRGLAVQDSWSLLALREGVLPTVLQALRVALRVSICVAARGGGGVYDGKDGSHPLLDISGGGLNLSRLLVALQCEALLAAGAALAAHPHEAIAALNGAGDAALLLTESLTAALALDGAMDDDHLQLAWARAECALALLQECLPVVHATRRVQGRMAQQERTGKGAGGGGGFPWGSSSSSTGGHGAADVEVGSSSSSLTVQALGAVLLEGLTRGVPRIELLLCRAPPVAVASSGDAR